ncbi:hypothetical protein [Coralloluteibacterium thermophilus]|uniref:AB hydrolase-1 domain-containing protein n=1 Tax=Coralloluteibacterium thermophilum TaxID=2707049 RepID=A0ABV9NGM4_9GAMM
MRVFDIGPCTRGCLVLLFLLGLVAAASAQPLPVSGRATGLADGPGLRATVFGPDRERLAELPGDVPVREIRLAVEGARPVPDLFWFNRKLRVWFSRQKGPAPLVVVIAGTGGDGNTQKLGMLRAALYGEGYHVLTLPSPTFPGFVVAASSTGVAGDLTQDAIDLRRVIRQVVSELPRGVEITGLHAVGYSLGGAHAAVIKALDTGPDALGVQRVVMINPPVSLFASVGRLDRLFADTIGDDNADIERFYQRLYAELAHLYRGAEALELDGTFLLQAAPSLLRSDDEFAAAIALSFRLALVNMFFAADYYAGTGVVVDPAAPPRVGDSLGAAFRELRARPFADYFERVFAPYYLALRPDWTREQLIAGSSLELIGPQLAADRDVYAQTSRNDLILDARELAWLRDTLGPRIVVYDHGGHLGNLGERQQIEDMLRMLAGTWDAGEAP